ncbi:MAG: hypothetical protein Q4F27_01490, partial [Desulfovibrionaceae bacterium]|nr:hypothetical protein [Desulfovibrionaceae bacterium]
MHPLQKKHKLFLAILISVQIVLCSTLMLSLYTWGKDIATHTESTLHGAALDMAKERLVQRVEGVFDQLKLERDILTRDLGQF